MAKFRCRQKPATKNCSARATILAPDATISEGLGYREELVGEYREAIGALKARVAAQKAELKLARDELERGVDTANCKDVEISRLRREPDTASRNKAKLELEKGELGRLVI